MKKLFLVFLFLPTCLYAGSYPVPLPSTSNNVMISTGKKWISGGPLTTKGDLFTYSTANTRVGVGSHGQVLSSDTGQATGLSWITNTPTLPLTTKGDILVYSSSNDRQAVGTHGFFLSSDTSAATGLSYKSSSFGQTTAASGTTTADASGETYVFAAAGTLVLPAAATVPGKKFSVINTSTASLVTVDGNASETICDKTTVTVQAEHDSILIQSDGSNWAGLAGACWIARGAKLDCDAASSIVTQRNDWLDSLGNRAGTGCSATITSGVFSAAPYCTASNDRNVSTNRVIGVLVSSITAFEVTGRTLDDAGYADFLAYVNCVGPR